MAYLIFNTQKEADDRAAQAWVEVLGRPKNPQDVTEFLWGRSQVGKDGRVAIEIPDDKTTWGIPQAEALAVTVTAQEEAAKVAQLDPVNWPKPAQTVDTIK